MRIQKVKKQLEPIPKCLVKARGSMLCIYYVREDFPICAYDLVAHEWLGLCECFTGSKDIRKEIYAALGIEKLNTVLSFEDLCKVVDNGSITCLLNNGE